MFLGGKLDAIVKLKNLFDERFNSKNMMPTLEHKSHDVALVAQRWKNQGKELI